LLPIKPKGKGENRIKGVSGASAGAITALMLAMGVDSKQLEKLLNRSQDFNSFFDKPRPGFYRSVNEKNIAVEKTDASTGSSWNETIKLIKQRKENLDFAQALARVIYWAIPKFFDLSNDLLLERLDSDLDRYTYSLIYDRGVFTGFALRTYIRGTIEILLGSRLAKMGLKSLDVNFEQFYELTGVDLVVTGTNITQKCPLNFSHKLTPHFPVAEAVGISMTFPGLFKPVWVNAQVPTNSENSNPDNYKGFWVDGGLLNNLPIHAFDDLGTTKSSNIDPNLYPLNPNLLGIRLTDGFKDPLENVAEERKVAQEKKSSVYDNLIEYVLAVKNTILYPSEQGQIRTIAEQEQVIELYTEKLTTTEFAPSQEKRIGPIRQAEEDVLAYFGLPPFKFPL
jgi:NTE family protein